MDETNTERRNSSNINDSIILSNNHTQNSKDS